MDQFADDASIVRTREFLTTASQMNGMLIIGTAIILSGTVALIGGRWILRPITRRRKQAATNFSIADLVALLLLLQLILLLQVILYSTTTATESVVVVVAFFIFLYC